MNKDNLESVENNNKKVVYIDRDGISLNLKSEVLDGTRVVVASQLDSDKLDKMCEKRIKMKDNNIDEMCQEKMKMDKEFHVRPDMLDKCCMDVEDINYLVNYNTVSDALDIPCQKRTVKKDNYHINLDKCHIYPAKIPEKGNVTNNKHDINTDKKRNDRIFPGSYQKKTSTDYNKLSKNPFLPDIFSKSTYNSIAKTNKDLNNNQKPLFTGKIQNIIKKNQTCEPIYRNRDQINVDISPDQHKPSYNNEISLFENQHESMYNKTIIVKAPVYSKDYVKNEIDNIENRLLEEKNQNAIKDDTFNRNPDMCDFVSKNSLVGIQSNGICEEKICSIKEINECFSGNDIFKEKIDDINIHKANENEEYNNQSLDLEDENNNTKALNIKEEKDKNEDTNSVLINIEDNHKAFNIRDEDNHQYFIIREKDQYIINEEDNKKLFNKKDNKKTFIIENEGNYEPINIEDKHKEYNIKNEDNNKSLCIKDEEDNAKLMVRNKKYDNKSTNTENNKNITNAGDEKTNSKRKDAEDSSKATIYKIDQNNNKSKNRFINLKDPRPKQDKNKTTPQEIIETNKNKIMNPKNKQHSIFKNIKNTNSNFIENLNAKLTKIKISTEIFESFNNCMKTTNNKISILSNLNSKINDIDKKLKFYDLVDLFCECEDDNFWNADFKILRNALIECKNTIEFFSDENNKNICNKSTFNNDNINIIKEETNLSNKVEDISIEDCVEDINNKLEESNIENSNNNKNDVKSNPHDNINGEIKKADHESDINNCGKEVNFENNNEVEEARDRGNINNEVREANLKNDINFNDENSFLENNINNGAKEVNFKNDINDNSKKEQNACPNEKKSISEYLKKSQFIHNKIKHIFLLRTIKSIKKDSTILLKDTEMHKILQLISNKDTLKLKYIYLRTRKNEIISKKDNISKKYHDPNHLKNIFLLLIKQEMYLFFSIFPLEFLLIKNNCLFEKFLISCFKNIFLDLDYELLQNIKISNNQEILNEKSFEKYNSIIKCIDSVNNEKLQVNDTDENINLFGNVNNVDKFAICRVFLRNLLEMLKSEVENNYENESSESVYEI